MEFVKEIIVASSPNSSSLSFNSSLKTFPSFDPHSLTISSVQFSSVAQSCTTLCNPMDCSSPGLPIHHQLPECTQTHVHWVGYAISSSVVCFSSHHQSFPAPGSLQVSQFFSSDNRSIGVSASASILPMNIQDWFPLGWTGWLSLQSKELARVLTNTTFQKHQFVGARLSL